MTVVNPEFSESSPDELLSTDSPISGRRIAFVGKLGSMNRREARELVRRQTQFVQVRALADAVLVLVELDDAVRRRGVHGVGRVAWTIVVGCPDTRLSDSAARRGTTLVETFTNVGRRRACPYRTAALRSWRCCPARWARRLCSNDSFSAASRRTSRKSDLR